MTQDERRCRGFEITPDEVAGGFVQEMPHTAHHTLLHRPRVRPHLQHLDIMIRFEQQQVRAAEMEPYRIGHISEICSNAELDSLRAQAVTDWIPRVVRNGEAIDFNIADP